MKRCLFEDGGQASQRKACPPALPYCHCAFGTTGARAPGSDAGASA